MTGPATALAAPHRLPRRQCQRYQCQRIRKVKTVADARDDEELLAALRQAHRARQAVPPEFVEAAKSAFAWHNIDAELAQLTYDSYRETADATRTRYEAASIRNLTFTSASLSIELEVAEDMLLGQVIPPPAPPTNFHPRPGLQ